MDLGREEVQGQRTRVEEWKGKLRLGYIVYEEDEEEKYLSS